MVDSQRDQKTEQRSWIAVWCSVAKKQNDEQEEETYVERHEIVFAIHSPCIHA